MPAFRQACMDAATTIAKKSLGMPMSITSRFQFIDNNKRHQDVYIGECPLFASIRNHTRMLFSLLHQPEGDSEENKPARTIIFELMSWLTSPQLPDLELLKRCGLGDDKKVRRRWGDSVAQTVEILNKLIISYNKEGSVLNRTFAHEFIDVACGHKSENIKIWCHRKQRDLFRELLDGLVDIRESNFICTLSEYRESHPFDVLFLFGSFRSNGYSSIPAALVTSPLYARLMRFVWAGLPDEEGFANDPVLSKYNHFNDMHTTYHMVRSDASSIEPFLKSMGVIESHTLEDDARLFDGRIIDASLSQQCVMVEFMESLGVLLKPRTRVLVFNKNRATDDCFEYRLICEVEADEFLIIHDANADFGDVSVDAQEFPLARMWKKALADLWSHSPQACIDQMQQAGINLINLSRAVQKWISTNGTVIHAPRSRRHFELLFTKVLKQSLSHTDPKNGKAILNWHTAWAEIESSRAAAIQHGTVESDIINEQLLTELRQACSEIKKRISIDDIYRYSLRPESGLMGDVIFKCVLGVNSGFSAPIEYLDKTLSIIDLEQYRTPYRGH